MSPTPPPTPPPQVLNHHTGRCALFDLPPGFDAGRQFLGYARADAGNLTLSPEAAAETLYLLVDPGNLTPEEGECKKKKKKKEVDTIASVNLVTVRWVCFFFFPTILTPALAFLTPCL